jgi:O-glycosyl hydrolase
MKRTRKRKRARPLPPGFTWFLAFMAWGCSPPAASDLTLTVDASMRHQIMDGFGGTLTLFEDDGIFQSHEPTQPPRTSATTAQKQAIAEQLYRDIGITRTRVFPVSFEPVNDDSDPFSLMASAFQWSMVDPLIDWVTLSRPSGLRTWFASFGTNGGTPDESWLRMPGDACALDTARLDEYVEWLLAVALRFRERGAELPYLTINNEPDFCPISGNPTPFFLDTRHFAEAVKRLGARLEENGLAAKIVIADGVTPGTSLPYVRAALEDPLARVHVGAIAFHSYDGYQDPARLREAKPVNPDARRELSALAKQYDLPLWMTEVCYCAPQPGGDYELARLRLNHVVDELTSTEVSAFDVMNTNFIARPGVRDELVEVRFNADGTLAAAEIAMYGRLIGHYAQAAPSGALRIDARATDARVRVVAFMRPDGKTALVALNNADVDLRAAVSGSWSRRVTVENDPWRSDTVSDSVVLPARSVTTLIGG